ncbi:hypothetical protein JOQ06_022184, partial [Pogonophryne albipinna]
MALTTTLHDLKNVRQFFVYIKETPPQTSRLTQQDLVKIIRELKASIRSWNRPVVLHQMRVKGRKDAAMHFITELQDCRRLALVAFPKLLSKLEGHFTNIDLWKLFGCVTAYLASLCGHRLGVFLNMTDVEVSQAVHGPEKVDYLLKMSNHKTSESFGIAKMLLSSEEYGWPKKANKKKMSMYLFFNTTFSKTKNLTKHLQIAWSEMNLRGIPTFISLRSAVATFALAFVNAEFKRITTINLQSKFFSSLDIHSTSLIDVYTKKGGVQGKKIKSIMLPITQTDSIDVRRECILKGLCVYFNEDPEKLVKEYMVVSPPKDQKKPRGKKCHFVKFFGTED